MIKLEHLLLTNRLTKKVLDLELDKKDLIFNEPDHSTMCEIHVILEHLYKEQYVNRNTYSMTTRERII